MKLRSLSLAALLSLCSLGASGGGDSETLVIIRDFRFIPQHITIQRGQTLTWENREKRQYHSVWFEALGETEPEDYLFPEDRYQRQFPQTGSFPYRCGPHPEMTGSVTVVD